MLRLLVPSVRPRCVASGSVSVSHSVSSCLVSRQGHRIVAGLSSSPMHLHLSTPIRSIYAVTKTIRPPKKTSVIRSINVRRSTGSDERRMIIRGTENAVVKRYKADRILRYMSDVAWKLLLDADLLGNILHSVRRRVHALEKKMFKSEREKDELEVAQALLNDLYEASEAKSKPDRDKIAHFLRYAKKCGAIEDEKHLYDRILTQQPLKQSYPHLVARHGAVDVFQKVTLGGIWKAAADHDGTR